MPSTNAYDAFYKITDIFPVHSVGIVTARGVFRNPLEKNENSHTIELLEQKIGFKPAPTAEQVFYYIYALLFSTGYRREYGQGFKIDLNRVAFTGDCDLFFDMAKIGERLAAIHLLKSPELNHTFSTFTGGAGSTVSNATYDPSIRRIYIDKTHYFSNITPDLWEYRLCGSRVMAKWLKSRKGQSLNAVDIEHYIKIARVLQLTIQYQEQTDRLYPAVTRWKSPLL